MSTRTWATRWRPACGRSSGGADCWAGAQRILDPVRGPGLPFQAERCWICWEPALSRAIEFPVFDADNHMYETTDAFTKYLPAEYSGLVRYVQVGNRTKIALRGQISEYIPNPTFNVVAPPGAQELEFRLKNPSSKTK